MTKQRDSRTYRAGPEIRMSRSAKRSGLARWLNHETFITVWHAKDLDVALQAQNWSHCRLDLPMLV